MAKQQITQKQILNDDLTGADLNHEIGIYDETHAYTVGRRCFWDCKIYECVAAVTPSNEGDLSNNPSINTGDWSEVALGAGTAWGEVTGTLANQTDLQTALDGKALSEHGHDHNNLTNYEADRHINWTVTSAAPKRLHVQRSEGASAITGQNTYQSTEGLAGVYGYSNGCGHGYLGSMIDGVRAGVHGKSGTNASSLAAYFDGDVQITGDAEIARTRQSYVCKRTYQQLSVSGVNYFCKVPFLMYANTNFIQVRVFQQSNDALVTTLSYGVGYDWDFLNTQSPPHTIYGFHNSNHKTGIRILTHLSSAYYYVVTYHEIHHQYKYHLGLYRTDGQHLRANIPPRLMFTGLLRKMMWASKVPGQAHSYYVRYQASTSTGTILTKTYRYPTHVGIVEFQKEGGSPPNVQIEFYRTNYTQNKIPSSISRHNTARYRAIPVRVHTGHLTVITDTANKGDHFNLSSGSGLDAKGEYFVKVRNTVTNEVWDVRGVLKLKPIVLKTVHENPRTDYGSNWQRRYLGRIIVPYIRIPGID